MSIAALVTRGYGTPGSVALVVTRGYTSGEPSIDVGTQWLLAQVTLDLPEYFRVVMDADALAADLAHMVTDTAMGWAEAFTVGGSGPYYGIFDDEAIELGSRDKDPPTLLVQATDAETWQQGDAVVIRTLTYYIAGLQPDGVGLVRLILEPPQ